MNLKTSSRNVLFVHIPMLPEVVASDESLCERHFSSMGLTMQVDAIVSVIEVLCLGDTQKTQVP